MAEAASFSHALSNFFSYLSLNNRRTSVPYSQKTQLQFPPSSPSISLPTLNLNLKPPRNRNRNRNGLSITSMGTYNVQVVVDDNEPEERLLGRFRREVSRAGIIRECKRRRFFENSHDKKKRKSRDAAMRYRKRRPQPRGKKQENTETPKKKESNDFEDDNWDLPKGDLPY